MKGYYNHKDNLWDIPFPNQDYKKNTHLLSYNFIVHRDKSKNDLANFCTTYSILKARAKENLHSFPGISGINFKHIIITNEAINKGHLDQE